MLSRPPGLGLVTRNGCILCCDLFCYINPNVTFLKVGGGGRSQIIIKKNDVSKDKTNF